MVAVEIVVTLVVMVVVLLVKVVLVKFSQQHTPIHHRVYHLKSNQGNLVEHIMVLQMLHTLALVVERAMDTVTMMVVAEVLLLFSDYRMVTLSLLALEAAVVVEDLAKDPVVRMEEIIINLAIV